MPNQAGNAYALTTLCPLVKESGTQQSPETLVRDYLNDLGTGEQSPLAKVPNTYLCRFFVLDNVVYEGKPARHESLKSSYLVFTSNLHGNLEPWLEGMWQNAEPFVRQAFRYCVDFSSVKDARSFVRYVQRCQVKTTFYFMGSNDEPLNEQLKALYLKQEFSKFVFENQNKPPAELQKSFAEFVARTKPSELQGPIWRPGASSLEHAVIGEEARA